jgi:hypothetical protein
MFAGWNLLFISTCFAGFNNTLIFALRRCLVCSVITNGTCNRQFVLSLVLNYFKWIYFVVINVLVMKLQKTYTPEILRYLNSQILILSIQFT